MRNVSERVELNRIAEKKKGMSTITAHTHTEWKMSNGGGSVQRRIIFAHYSASISLISFFLSHYFIALITAKAKKNIHSTN